MNAMDAMDYMDSMDALLIRSVISEYWLYHYSAPTDRSVRSQPEPRSNGSSDKYLTILWSLVI